MVETYDTHFDLERIFDAVLLLRDEWDKRAPNMEFYTLGKTVYLDGNTPAYFDCREGTNLILLSGELPLSSPPPSSMLAPTHVLRTT